MITVETKALKFAMKMAKEIVETRPSVPILENVLLKWEGGLLSITATDLDMQATHECGTEPKNESNSVTVPFQSLSKFLCACGTPEISLEAVDGEVIARAAKASTKICTLPVEDLPLLEESGWEPMGTIPASSLAHSLETVRHAIWTEVTRYYLNGVYLHNDDGKHVIVATDGHRLHHSPLRDSELVFPDWMEGTLIPRKFVQAILKCLPKEGHVAISHYGEQKRRLKFEWEGQSWITKEIDGTFPDWHRVVPRETTFTYELPKDEVEKAVKFILKMKDGYRGLKIAPGDDSVIFSMQNAEGDTAQYEIQASAPPEAFAIGCDPAYLRDILDSLSGDIFSFAIQDPAGPFIVRAADEPEGGEFCVLMPMRLE